MKKLKKYLYLIVAISIGIFFGLSFYTFLYAKGLSYFSNNPEACINCHVMQSYFDGWIKSSHRSVAVCNDCHTPDAVVSKLYVKAENGFWHSFYFTTNRYPDNIQIRNLSRTVVENSCRKCHEAIIIAMDGNHPQQTNCLQCHSTVGH